MAEILPDYGLAAEFSEHKRGASITYTLEDGKTHTGEILWVPAPTDERGVCYIVAPDVDTGWIDHVYPGEVVLSRGDEGQVPTLVKCPYCPGNTYQYEGQIEQYPNNPNKAATIS